MRRYKLPTTLRALSEGAAHLKNRFVSGIELEKIYDGRDLVDFAKRHVKNDRDNWHYINRGIRNHQSTSTIKVRDTLARRLRLAKPHIEVIPNDPPLRRFSEVHNIKENVKRLKKGKELIREGIADSLMAYGSLAGLGTGYYLNKRLKTERARVKDLQKQLLAKEVPASDLVDSWR